MAIRSKTKKRIAVLSILTVLICAILVTIYFTQQKRRNVAAQQYRKRGIEAVENGEYITALDNLGRYLRRNRHDVEALYQFAQARLEIDEPNGQHILLAIGILKLVCDLQPDHDSAGHELLKLYTLARRNTETLYFADTILDRSPGDLDALRAKTIAFMRLQRFEEARSNAEIYLASDETDIGMHLMRFSLLQRLDYPIPEVLKEAEELHHKHPNDPQFELLLGYAHMLNQNREQVVKWMNSAAQRTPPNDAFVLVLVKILDEAQLFSESLAVLERSAKSDGHLGIKRELARRYWESRKLHSLKALLDDLDLSSRQTDPDLMAIRAMGLFQIGIDAEAELIITALESRANDKIAATWVSVLRATYRPSPDQEPAQIVEICRAAVKSVPTNPYIHALVGEAYSSMGRLDRSLASWDRAASLRPIWSAPHIRRARILLAQGQPEIALRAAERAVLLAPTSIDAAVVWSLTRAANLTHNQNDSASDLLVVVSEIMRVAPYEERVLPLRITLLKEIGANEEAVQVAKAALSKDQSPSESMLLELAEIIVDVEPQIEELCYQRLDELYGYTPGLALARALRAAEDGDESHGTRLLKEAVDQHVVGDSIDWQIAWAKYLDKIGDPQAAAQWIALADANLKNGKVQQLSLDAKSVRTERDFVDRTIAQLRRIQGDASTGWRLKRAEWLMRNADNQHTNEEAVTILEKIVSDSPTFVEARLLLAQSLKRINDVGRAIEELTAAAYVAPDSNVITLRTARMLQIQKEFVRAKEQLHLVLQDESARREDLYQVAAMFVRQGDDTTALEVLARLGAQPTGFTPQDNLLLAQVLLRRHEYGRVDDICRQLMDQPTAASVAFVAGYCASQSRSDEANAVLAKLDELDLPPGHREFIRGQYYSRYVDAKSAFEQFQSAVQAAPGNANFWYRLVTFHLVLGRTDAALLAAQEGLDALPDNARLAYLIERSDLVRTMNAKSQLRPLVIAFVNDPVNQSVSEQVLRTVVDAEAQKVPADQIIITLRHMADGHPNFMPLQILLGQLYLAIGRANDAAEISTRTMYLYPTKVEPIRLAAEALASARRWDEALDVARKWRMHTATLPAGADMMIARAKIQTGDPAGAVQQLQPYLERALKDPNSNSQMIILYAQALIAQDNPAAAENLLSPLLSHPTIRTRWSKWALENIDDDQTVQTWLDRVEEEIPQASIHEWIRLAESWLVLAKRSGNVAYRAQARQVIDAAVEHPYVTAEAWFLRAQIAEKEENLSVAEESYRGALKLNPQLHSAKNNLSLILANQRTSLPEALQLAKEAAESQPTAVAYLDTLAHIQATTEQYDNAITNLEKAIKLQPDNTRLKKNLAKIYTAAGREAEASEILRSLHQG